jgi:hypothetical protein
MRRAAFILGCLAGAVAARAARAADWTVDTTTTAGYRMVDIDGSKPKFREDYNLRSGLRLFDFDVAGAAKEPEKTRLDRFHLLVERPGDEPFSRFSLTAADRQLYDLRVAFTRSKYYYAVPQLFEAPVSGDVRTDDLHDWNFVRTNGAVDLTVHPPHLPTLLLGYRLYQRNGGSVSTVELPAGDTFLVHAPVDDHTHSGRLGTEFRALSTDVFLQQEFRRVNRNVRRDGPLDPAGLDPTDPSTLASLSSASDEHIDIPITTVRLRRPFGEVAELAGAYVYSHANLGFDTRQASRGAPTPLLPASASARGGGDATLDTHIADLGASWRVVERVRLHLDYRFHERSRDGQLDETSTFGFLAARTGDHLRRHAVTGEVEWEPRDDLSLRAGLRWSQRDANFSESAQAISTHGVGAVGGIRYRPWSFLDLFARYENVQLDDPFTVPGDPAGNPPLPEREIALTFVNRATAGWRLTPRDWIELRYQFTADSRENDSYDARARAFGNTAAITLEPLKSLLLFLSYTRRNLDRRADILVAPLYLKSTSVQDGTEDVLSTEARWDFALAGQRLSTGCDLAYVAANDSLRPRLEADAGFQTAYDLNRIDAGAYLTWHHRWLEPGIEVRRIEYDERVLGANDYDATVLVIKVTKRFGF